MCSSDLGQTLYVAPFAELLKQHAQEVEGAGFEQIFARLWGSMETELLPNAAEQLLIETSRPRQDVAVGYWRDLLDRPIADLTVWAATRLAVLRAARVPYRVIAGDELDPVYRDWLVWQLPQAGVTVVPCSGHFPHLADPPRFARCLLEL